MVHYKMYDIIDLQNTTLAILKNMKNANSMLWIVTPQLKVFIVLFFIIQMGLYNYVTALVGGEHPYFKKYLVFI